MFRLWDRRAYVIDNHDGDTLTMFLDLGFDITITKSIRLQDVYAPELKEVGGPETKKFLAGLIQEVSVRGMELGLDWPWIVTTTRLKSDKAEVTTFGRYVATVTPDPRIGGESANIRIQTFVDTQGYNHGIGG